MKRPEEDQAGLLQVVLSQGCFPDIRPPHNPVPLQPVCSPARREKQWLSQMDFLHITLAFCRTVPFPVTMTDKGRFFKAVAELTGEFSALFAGLALFT